MIEEPVFAPIIAAVAASTRVLALFVAAPVFSHAALPVRVRVALALAVTAALSPAAPDRLVGDGGLLGLTSLVLWEIVVGLALGFSVRLLFTTFDLLGELVSIQGGLGAANVVDPTSGASSVALASTFRIFAALVFLAVDGHHELLRAVALSYELFPLGGEMPRATGFLGVVGLTSQMFELAFRLAAPVTIAMLVSNVAVGILGRSIPQLNLIMIQLPAHVAITLGLLVLGATALTATAGEHIRAFARDSMAALVGAT